jgi:hypothetical protein
LRLLLLKDMWSDLLVAGAAPVIGGEARKLLMQIETLVEGVASL